jgi:Cofactor assembly of complex C subunit B, CCB2/CCB4
LYGLGRIELADRRAAVEVGGVDVRDGFLTDDADAAASITLLSNEVLWTATALFDALPNVKSFAVVLNSGKCFRLGRFRSREATPFVAPGGIACRTLETGKRAYLADLKVVPVKEVEFGFLPKNCQVRTGVSPSLSL